MLRWMWTAIEIEEKGGLEARGLSGVTNFEPVTDYWDEGEALGIMAGVCHAERRTFPSFLLYFFLS